MSMKTRVAIALIPLAMLMGVVAPAPSAGASDLLPQKITFPQTSATIYTSVGQVWSPSATGGASGNPVVFSIDPSSTSGCVFSASTGEITFDVPTGTCIIDANQAGNATYAAAPQAQHAIGYSLPLQPLTIKTSVPILRVGMTYQFVATDVGGSNNPVVFSRTLSSTSGCVVDASGFTTFNAPSGTCIVIVKKAGNSNYAAAQSGWDFKVSPALSGTTPPTTTTTSTGSPSVLVTYSGKTIAFTATSKSQLAGLAVIIKQDDLKSVTVNSYVNQGGPVRASNLLSQREAQNIVHYLKWRLTALKVRGVSFKVVSHGATSFVVTPPTSLNNRRSEVTASA